MRQILLTIACLFCFASAFGQNEMQLSLVFAGEPQNKMASRIPALLMEAYRKGAIAAYYPASPNVRIPYAQFLKHYNESAKAQQALTGNPDWFCAESELPKINNYLQGCLSERFELVEKWTVNRVTMQNELQPEYIRLIHSETCDPRGFETYGPMFKLSDIEKLKQKQYRLINPQNQAGTYSIFECVKLRLFNAVKRKE